MGFSFSSYACVTDRKKNTSINSHIFSKIVSLTCLTMSRNISKPGVDGGWRVEGGGLGGWGDGRELLNKVPYGRLREAPPGG